MRRWRTFWELEDSKDELDVGRDFADNIRPRSRFDPCHHNHLDHRHQDGSGGCHSQRSAFASSTPRCARESVWRFRRR